MPALNSNPSGEETCAKRVCERVLGGYTVQATEVEAKIRLEASLGLAGWLPGVPVSEIVGPAVAAMCAQKKSGGRGSGLRHSVASRG
jgi:hypothetical protein